VWQKPRRIKAESAKEAVRWLDQGGAPLCDTIARVLRSYGLSPRRPSVSADPSTGFTPAASDFTDADFDITAPDGDDWRALGATGLRRVVIGRVPSDGVPLSPDHADAPIVRAVVAAPSEPDAQSLRSLHAHGVRGARFGWDQSTNPEDVLRYADRLVTLGWHLEIDLSGCKLGHLADAEWTLTQMPIALCFAGLAGFVAARSEGDTEIALLLEMVHMGRFWLKLSGAEIAATDASTQERLRSLVGATVAARQDRLIWGSGPKPPEVDTHAHLDTALRALREWLPDDATRRAVLWSNPATLYRF